MAIRAYLAVEEIEKSSVNWSAVGVPDPVKSGFADEVILRLEQTGADKAVRFLFADKKIANSYRNYVKQRVNKKLGKDVVRSHVTPSEKGTQHWIVFFRGSQWQSVVKVKNGH